ncbi:MAG: hypothetical protein ABI883_01245 [Chthoniobacterales bacterium]
MRYHLLLPLVLLPTLSGFAQRPATVDEGARLLAGLPVEGPLEACMQSTGWQQHARAMDNAWAKKQRRQIEPIRAWMNANAGPYFHDTGTMYYMFSGPDALYANTFFPDASTYILAGLEPVGQIPDLAQMRPEQLAAALAAMRGSLGTMLRFQYFITKDMRTDLGPGGVSGTLPLLCVFLARMGNTVMDVTRVSSPAEGVKITFAHPQRRRTQTLYYFKTDLSGSSGFLKWCAARGPGVSLLKAASYLMHGQDFAGVRDFLLKNSRVIVQDDSGIPLRAFGKPWAVHCFGRYVPHKEMFDKFYQTDLAAVFTNNPPSELGFAFGYHWQVDRGILMLATRE